MSATIAALRRWGAETLKSAGVETAQLDARLLLQHAAGLAHEALAADPERTVADEPFRTLINRRAAREPLSRILGEREFYGRVFKITPSTLDPRPDTETLIAEALKIPFASVLDLGAGSGAIIVTLLAERAEARGTASDISKDALAAAKENAGRHGVAQRLTLHHANWFDGLDGRFDLIVSNPPYIPLGVIAGLAPEVRDHDPLKSLDGGPDGLEAYRRIAQGAAARLASGGLLLLEIGAGQAEAVTAIMAAAGFPLAGQATDLGGHIRVLAFDPPQP